MSNFAETLTDILNECNKTVKDLEENNVLAKNTFYIFNNTMPALITAIKISNYLKVSMDYMFGRTENNKFKPYKICQKNFYQNLEKIREMFGVTKSKLCNDLEISRTNITRWKNGTNPSVTKLIDLADYFDCDIDELLDREK